MQDNTAQENSSNESTDSVKNISTNELQLKIEPIISKQSSAPKFVSIVVDDTNEDVDKSGDNDENNGSKTPRYEDHNSDSGNESDIPTLASSSRSAKLMTPSSRTSTGISVKIELKPSDFYFGSTLGEGAFARVVHAKSKKTGADFAIKIMEKVHIKRENKVKHVLTERKVLTMVNHPFIIKFHFSFHDAGYLYMCMELAPGGILSDLIEKKLTENIERGIENTACDMRTTTFYMAELVEGLEYLHGLGIIHRDLKPENIIFSSDGHIRIADFGTSTICSDDDQSPRNSFVGTQDYVSPEVLAGDRAATKACDLWAVGCITYQMLTGKSPFREATEFLTFEAIMSHCKGTRVLEYPASMHAHAIDFIRSLLQANEVDRLGAGEDNYELDQLSLHRDGENLEEQNVAQQMTTGNGYKKLKAHLFFHCDDSLEIDWSNLPTSPAPYQPDPRSFPSSENMRDGAEDEWLLEGEPTPIIPIQRREDILNNHSNRNSVENAAITSQSSQKYKSTRIQSSSSSSGTHFINNSSVFTQFLKKNENQIFTSIVYKRKGLFSKRRQLILTDYPRLIYFDPQTMELKGEIPWTKEQPVSCMKKNFKEFDVKCSVTQRVYHLSDAEVGAQVWIDFINEMLEKQQAKYKLSQQQRPPATDEPRRSSEMHLNNSNVSSSSNTQNGNHHTSNHPTHLNSDGSSSPKSRSSSEVQPSLPEISNTSEH